ncbi:P2Y purinoceptor 2 [Lepisosteus oculatus]|uniref:P2Y purinoceptor 2 n=1 Tax=Lepisosteus oculatus TaxID=7918 RepID=W5NNV9_LEPOC|nr:PREDICTED: P2Y purinoceptor 2 [Lepisosteus oculatus]XP_015196966.1 PREDICTED: P2Y purinoceptor 2 [Lepisosteus oculatus]XP_015196967.1 PREDICTED: P2Y purinoceptor 2 [Lepisosteus oculatus]
MMATLNKSESNQSSPYRCSFDESFKYLLLPVSYGLVFLIGMALNCIAMYVIVFRTKRWKPSTIYMFNLIVSDTLYIFTLPFLIYYYAGENDWPFTEPFCKIVRFLFYTNLYGSILFLSCISIHRFLGICYPMQSLQWVSKHRTRLMSVGVWIAVITFQSPILYFSRTTEVGEVNMCYDTTSSELFEDFLVYSSFISIMLFCIPFVVVVVCYGLMVRKLLEPSAGGSCSSKSKQKSIRMIIIVLVVFMVCFLPFHLTRTLYYILRYLGKDISCSALEGASIAYKVTRPLASANSCLDPILYFLAGQGIRKKQSVEKKKLSLKAGTAKLSSTQL